MIFFNISLYVRHKSKKKSVLTKKRSCQQLTALEKILVCTPLTKMEVLFQMMKLAAICCDYSVKS